MRFRIERVWVNNADSILEKYPKLKKMKNLSVEDDYLYLTTDSLADVIEIYNLTNNELVITSDYMVNDEPEALCIEIYDNYRE